MTIRAEKFQPRPDLKVPLKLHVEAVVWSASDGDRLTYKMGCMHTQRSSLSVQTDDVFNAACTRRGSCHSTNNTLTYSPL